jgi:hypothetical protein
MSQQRSTCSNKTLEIRKHLWYIVTNAPMHSFQIMVDSISKRFRDYSWRRKDAPDVAQSGEASASQEH